VVGLRPVQASQDRAARVASGLHDLPHAEGRPDLTRDTVGNLRRKGFRLQREENVYLDIVKAIEATK